MPCAEKPQHAIPSGMFHGDGDDMVDALIAACQQSKLPVNPKANPMLVGRELQPFSFDDAPATHCTSGSPSNKRKNVSPSKNQARRSLDGMQETQRRDKNQTKGTKVGHAPTAPIACPNPSVAHRPVGRGTSTSTGSPSYEYACPAMFHSPKPEAVPMPTLKLMMRAAYTCCEHAVLPACAVVA